MSPKITTFTLVGQVILRITAGEDILYAELDPAEAYLVGSQLLRAGSDASRLLGRAPPDFLRSDPAPLLSGE